MQILYSEYHQYNSDARRKMECEPWKQEGGIWQCNPEQIYSLLNLVTSVDLERCDSV